MTEETKSFKYDVFISYSRRDEAFASKLEQALENYKPEKDLKVPQRYMEIFRDREDFSSGDYHKNLLKNLNNSSKLLLICSPAARKSQFVSDEIKQFVNIRGADHIIPVLFSGIPNNEAKTGHEEEMAFPEELCKAIEMPLAVNYLGFDAQKDKFNKSIFSHSWYSILADVYELSRSDIEQREKRRRVRKRRITLSVLSGSLLILSVLLIFALISRSQALTAQKESEAQTIKANDALRAAYIENGRQELINNYPFRAAVYLNEAYQIPLVNQDQSKISSLQFLLGQSMKSVNSLLSTLQHQNIVYSARLSPDGRKIATASYDKTAKVWNVEIDKILLSLKNEDSVRSVALSPDGRKIAITNYDNRTAKVWDAYTGNILYSLEHQGNVSSAEFSSDGMKVLTASDDFTVKVWNADTGELLLVLELGKVVNSVSFSPDSKKIVTTKFSKIAEVWDANTGKLLHELKHFDSVYSAKFSPNGKKILTDSEDNITNV